MRCAIGRSIRGLLSNTARCSSKSKGAGRLIPQAGERQELAFQRASAPSECSLGVPLALFPKLPITHEALTSFPKASAKVRCQGPYLAQNVAFKDKQSSVSNRNLRKELWLVSGAAMRPHPDKVITGGEDAYFVEGMRWVGVADGVGGWASVGIDAGLYSRELMANCAMFAKLEDGIPDPKGVLIKSVGKTKAYGTCTAVLAALYKQTLYATNIGDSGFLVIRNGEVVAKSTAMQWEFNYPYQIGFKGDSPSAAQTFKVPMNSGDVLLLATDGLFDNLYEREILDVVQAGREKGVKPEVVAMWLVKLAHAAGNIRTGRSPFSDAAAMSACYSYTGGKLDDVTVVISYVSN